MEELIGKTVPLNEKLIFIDLETANNSNNICQIGAIVCENGKVVKTIETILDPQAEFLHDRYHTGLHGIDENDIISRPTLKQVWEDNFSFYSSDFTFVGHNIKSADSTWLLQDLKRNGINLRRIYCYDTYELANRFIKKDRYHITNYKLETLCNCLNIPYDRLHDAFADALACFELFWRLLETHEVNLSYFRYAKSLPLTEQEENRLNELKRTLWAEKDKLKKLKAFRAAVRTQDNELAISLSEEYSVYFTEDIELHQMLVNIPDDAVYTNDEINQLTEKIKELQEKIQAIKQRIDELL